ncbi:MAG: PP2C family protein-serine/threonine phosphatase [Desulfobacterales bacterium]|nr:PP2C family protein-serine/threonine phosphatase [Desulfobacterales bacterium]
MSKIEKSVNNRLSEKIFSDHSDFENYLTAIIHQWLKTLTTLAYTLVPAFFLLDFFTMPKELLPRFGVYRLASTLICLIQYFIIRHSKPGNATYYHGYFVSINVGGIIALMTVSLGGFNSNYYAGLNLVIIGVNLLLPWKAIHSAVNSIIIISMYIAFNLMAGSDFTPALLASNLFFLASTAIIAVSINHVKYKLVKKEFSLLAELKKARDALWSEMELAKRIQTALLPSNIKLKGYDIAAQMLPSKEVGGDYYDIISTAEGNKWVTIGDVSGHGVDSGLIMMMAQTSINAIVADSENCLPSSILKSVNQVIRENITRLGSDHYMTMMAINLNDAKMTLAGKHQDVIIYRYGANQTEIVSTEGTWIGITDNLEGYLTDTTVNLNNGDIVLLFTDGITESTNKEGEMFGQTRLAQGLGRYADLPVEKIVEKIVEETSHFQDEQFDDMSLVVIKKCPSY